MKKFISTFLFLFVTAFLFAQECSDLFISEYVEGSGNNKAIELYNPTNEAIDLSTYIIRRYSNGSPVASDDVPLSGSIQSKGVVVVTNGQTDSLWVDNGGYWSLPIDPVLYAKGDLHGSGIYPTAMYFNGNDALTLEKVTGEIVDIFGKIGTDPGSSGWNDLPPTYFAGDQYWTSWTKDQTLIRKASVKKGVFDNPNVFMVNVEWDSIAKDNFDSLGIHKCDCGTLGIKERISNHSLVIFPNPSDNQPIKISASEEITYLSVTNQLGQLVYTKEFETSQKSILIESGLLKSGVYILTTRFVDNSFNTSKLIVH